MKWRSRKSARRKNLGCYLTFDERSVLLSALSRERMAAASAVRGGGTLQPGSLRQFDLTIALMEELTEPRIFSDVMADNALRSLIAEMETTP